MINDKTNHHCHIVLAVHKTIISLGLNKIYIIGVRHILDYFVYIIICISTTIVGNIKRLAHIYDCSDSIN